MNLALLQAVLGRRDWRDRRTIVDNPLRMGIMAAASTLGLVVVLPMAAWWVAHGYDLGRFVGSLAYGAGPASALFILMFGVDQIRSHAVRERKDDYVLGVGSAGNVLIHLLLEPTIVLGYRLLRPLAVLALAAAFGVVEWLDAAIIALGVLVMLVTVVSISVFAGLIARTPWETRIGTSVVWIAVLVVAPTLASVARLRYGSLELPNHSLSALARVVVVAAPVWLLMGVLSVLAAWFSLRGRPVRLPIVAMRRRARSNWTLRRVVHAAIEADPRLRRGPARRAVTSALYLAIAFMPIVGWVAVLSLFERFMQTRVSSLSHVPMLDEVRLAGVSEDALGRGLRDSIVRDMYVALPGLVVAVTQLVVASGGYLPGGDGPWLVPVGFGFAIVSSYTMLRLVARLNVVRVMDPDTSGIPNFGRPAMFSLYAVVVVSYYILSSGIAPATMISMPGMARTMLWTYVAFLAFTAVHALFRLRNNPWPRLVAWVERDGAPPVLSPTAFPGRRLR